MKVLIPALLCGSLLLSVTRLVGGFFVPPGIGHHQGGRHHSPTKQTQQRPQTATTTRLFGTPEPLAVEGEWSAYLDDQSTGLVYYFNIRTGEAKWVPPTATFPTVALPRRLKRKADEKQQEYRKAVAATEQAREQQLGGGEPGETVVAEQQAATKEEDKWFAFLTDEEASAAAAETKEEEPDWFSGFFKPKAEEQQQQEQVEKKEEDWLSWFATTKEDAVATADEDVNGDVADEAAAAAAVVVEPEKKVEPQKKKVEPKKKVEEPVVPSEEKEGFFDKLFSAPAPGVQEQPVKEKEVKKRKEEVPEVVVVPSKKDIVPDISAYVTPDPKKIFWGGEDAVFVKGRTFGVFDGVSGASKLDGVPLYSKTMAEQMKKKVSKDEPLTIKQITNYLDEAVEYCNEKATGATTAIVGSIAEDGYLRLLNVGDSACVVVRDGRVVTRSRDINHFYECPYQFSRDSVDRGRDGTKLNFQLARGDIVVMGSDGIFDNLSNEALVEVIESSRNKRASTLAKLISDRSRKVSFDTRAETPFARLAKWNKNPDYPEGLGGKVDDIGCVVARFDE